MSDLEYIEDACKKNFFAVISNPEFSLLRFYGLEKRHRKNYYNFKLIEINNLECGEINFSCSIENIIIPRDDKTYILVKDFEKLFLDTLKNYHPELF